MAIRASSLDIQLHDMPDRFPPQVKSLPWREREIATVIYARGASTAKDVEEGLSYEISNAAARSMLKRLVRKGVLRRRPSGRGKAFVYVAAITTDDVKQKAVMQLTQDYFGGSLLHAALAVIDLLENDGAATTLVRAAAASESQSTSSARSPLDVLTAPDGEVRLVRH